MAPLTFRLFRFPIEIHGGFLAFLAVFSLFRIQAQESLASILIWCVVITSAFVVHELGHAFAARAFDLSVYPITLRFMVGTTPHQRTTAGKQLLISIAGPGAGLLLGLLGLVGLVFAPMTGSSLLYDLAEEVMFVNILLSVLNLLPVVPLDGGHALKSGVELGWGPIAGVKVSSAVSVILGTLAVFFGLQSGMIFLAVFAGFAVWTNMQHLREVGAI